MAMDVLLWVSEPRPRWKKGQVTASQAGSGRRRPSSGAPASASAKKPASRRPRVAATPALPPTGWERRLREQSHNVARAIEMLEQALTIMNRHEPTASALARAECLRGAGLLTLLAASEVLVVAGWFEADQAVSAGTL